MGKVKGMKLGARFWGSVGLSQLDRDYFATVSGDISQFGGSPSMNR